HRHLLAQEAGGRVLEERLVVGQLEQHERPLREVEEVAGGMSQRDIPPLASTRRGGRVRLEITLTSLSKVTVPAGPEPPQPGDKSRRRCRDLSPSWEKALVTEPGGG